MTLALEIIYYSNRKSAITFDYYALVQNTFFTLKKVVNVYIVYEIDNQPSNPCNIFTIKKCLLDAAK